MPTENNNGAYDAGAWVANAKYVNESLRQSRQDVKELSTDLQALREDVAAFKAEFKAKSGFIAAAVSAAVALIISIIAGKF